MQCLDFVCDLRASREGLIKISQGLYESILPLVRTQVESQIKVRDFSHAAVSIHPAEFKTWSDARNALLVESKRPLKAKLDADIAAAKEDTAEIGRIRVAYKAAEKEMEHKLDHAPLSMHMSLGVQYNFLSK